MAWMIDADVVTERLRGWIESPHGENVYNSGYDDAIRHVLDVIDHMPTLTSLNEWVSVEERLPEGNGGYIVIACDEGCPAGEGIWYDTVVVFAEYYDGCWTWNDGTEYDLTDIVTHWMPLPAPPDRRPPEGEEET